MQHCSTTSRPSMGSLQRALLTLALACGAWALLSAAGTQTANAAPAAPDVGTIHQPDGTAFQSRVFGDEWANGVETAAGYTVLQDPATGVWEYAERTRDNRLRASGRVVGRDRPGNIPKHLRDEVALAEGAELAEASHLPEPTSEPAPEPFSAPSLITSSTVTHKSLVLLASFTDQPSMGTTPASWHDRFFGPTGSVKDYYDEVSYGGLTFAPAAETQGTAGDGIVGWLPLNMPHPNGDNEAVRRAVKLAVEAADPFVDYASFDTNGDSALVPSELHVTLVAAGLEGSYPGTGKKVWGHRWSLHGTVDPPVVDGTHVTAYPYLYEPGYTAFGEMHGDHQATVGIIAHELGHDLGLPDLYDTDQSSEGVGNWSVMGGGSWGYLMGQYSGTTPSHPDAWSKWFQGWVTPTRVTASTAGLSVNAASSATNANVALQVRDNPNGVDWGFLAKHVGVGEYFLVENRQRTGYDASLPGSGLLVWHVNETLKNNRSDANRLVDLLEADGLGNLDITPKTTGSNRGDAGDPYPGSANNRSVSSTSTPNSKLNVSGAYSGVTIESIGDSGATMSATVHVPTVNDTFASATALSGRSSTRSERITEATRELNEATACGVDRSVWFKYTAPETATIALSTAGTPFDTALGVFTGSTVGGLTSVGCNGNAPGVTTSALSFAATAGTTYYVQAGNDVAAPGGVGDLTLSMQSSPTAPLNAAASHGNASATVTWEAPLSDGGSAITGYTVTASPGGATATAGGGDRQATVTGLTNGTAYTFTVVATNGVGNGPASAASNSVTPMTTPGAPTDVTAQRGNEEVTVAWTAPTDGGSPITGYTVTSSPGGATAAAGVDDRQATVTGLTNGIAYTFTVTATNALGNGPASAASAAVTPATLPGAPSAVSATRGDRAATVTWTAPVEDGGSPITGYTVTSSPGSIIATAGASAGEVTVTGLTNGIAYTFTVTATNALGNGPASAASPAVTPATVPDAPTNVASQGANGEATVTWTGSTSDGGSPITKYTVTASPGGATVTVGVDDRRATVSGLTNGIAYTFTVIATNAIGDGRASAASVAVTPATVPDAPSAVSATRGDTAATVTWIAPVQDGGSPITSYTVTSSPGDITAKTDAPAGGATVTGLTNGTEYTFTVVATNVVGDSAASLSSGPVTPEMLVTVPTAPVDVRATATEGTTTVGWTPPSWDGRSAITSYTVTALPSGITVSVPAGTTQTPIEGLPAGVASTFTVTATNAVGEGPPSIASNAVTPVANIAPVVTMTAPTARFTLNNTIVARWTATDADSAVATHDVRWRRALPGDRLPAWGTPAWKGLTVRKVALAGTEPGYTYCFQARSRDTVGNVSAWTAQRCTTTPVDDRALTAAGGWNSQKETGYYRRTYRQATAKGATLTYSVRTKQVTLVATRCPGCGVVDVTVGGVTIRRSLDNSKTQNTIQRKKLIPIASYTTAKSVTVTIKVMTGPARPVQIDGLGVTTH